VTILAQDCGIKPHRTPCELIYSSMPPQTRQNTRNRRKPSTPADDEEEAGTPADLEGSRMEATRRDSGGRRQPTRRDAARSRTPAPRGSILFSMAEEEQAAPPAIDVDAEANDDTEEDITTLPLWAQRLIKRKDMELIESRELIDKALHSNELWADINKYASKTMLNYERSIRLYKAMLGRHLT
jgi:hypothetical protein